VNFSASLDEISRIRRKLKFRSRPPCRKNRKSEIGNRHPRLGIDRLARRLAGDARRPVRFRQPPAGGKSRLNYALIEGYHNSLMKGRYPVCCLFLEIDPAAVDVNIHPAKREVKFHREFEVRKFVAQAVRDTLARVSFEPSETGCNRQAAKRAKWIQFAPEASAPVLPNFPRN
jgi:hypothetical protein